jgi:hypothetical protein
MRGCRKGAQSASFSRPNTTCRSYHLPFFAFDDDLSLRFMTGESNMVSPLTFSFKIRAAIQHRHCPRRKHPILLGDSTRISCPLSSNIFTITIVGIGSVLGFLTPVLPPRLALGQPWIFSGAAWRPHLLFFASYPCLSGMESA